MLSFELLKMYSIIFFVNFYTIAIKMLSNIDYLYSKYNSIDKTKT